MEFAREVDAQAFLRRLGTSNSSLRRRPRAYLRALSFQRTALLPTWPATVRPYHQISWRWPHGSIDNFALC
jgi:hypothetical protein